MQKGRLLTLRENTAISETNPLSLALYHNQEFSLIEIIVHILESGS